MVNSQSQPLNTIISWFFLGYFVVLGAERIRSLVKIFRSTGANLYSNAFDGYVNTMTILSLIATAIMLIFVCRSFWQSLVNASVSVDYSTLTIIAGVLLVSGMVHTEYTMAPIQFVSYGMLIVAMILRCVQLSFASENRFMLWYSLIFLTVFSMAIPVMYRSEITNATLFHVIEAVVSLALVVCFTWMLRDLFLGQGNNLLRYIPMLIAVIGDAVILAMRWKESVNSFVLIFLIVSVAVFAVGKVLFAVIK
ncbi:MAG: hypothetical protein SOZ62_01460 [Eubacteriales bacterium]|nr:hypothetical protein [Eubacteriales bacterium]